MELVILGLSTILQLVCLVAPGWWIITSKYSGSTSYEAIFYFITCEKSHCETMSWRVYWDKHEEGKTKFIVILLPWRLDTYTITTYYVKVLE